jgi:hypothetical protein
VNFKRRGARCRRCRPIFTISRGVNIAGIVPEAVFDAIEKETKAVLDAESENIQGT